MKNRFFNLNLRKEKLFSKFHQFLITFPENQSYFDFLEDHKEYFIKLNISPWELFFHSPLHLKIPEEQFLELTEIFNEFIRYNLLNFSLNGYINNEKIFKSVYRSGCFPQISTDYTVKFTKKLISLGLIATNEEVQYLIGYLKGYSLYSRRTDYKWNLREFLKVMKKSSIY